MNFPFSLRFVLAALLVLFTGACGLARKKKADAGTKFPPSPGLCVSIANNLADAVSAGEIREFDAPGSIDMPRMIQRSAAGQEMTAAHATDLTRLYHGWRVVAAPLLEATKGGGSYTVLQFYMPRGESRILARELSAEGVLSYHDLIFESRLMHGRYLAALVDIHDYSIGLPWSRRLRDTIILNGGGSYFKEGAGEADDITSPEVRRFHEEARRLTAEGRHAEVVALYKGLPAEPAETRGALMIYRTAARKIGGPDLIDALDRWMRIYPDEPGTHLAAIEKHFALRSYPAALSSVERLDSLVDGDPYLKYLRGVIAVRSGDSAMGKEWMKRAIKGEPFMRAPYWELFRINTFYGEFKEATTSLNSIAIRFGVELEEMEKAVNDSLAPQIRDRFVASKEFDDWRRLRLERRKEFGAMKPQERRHVTR